MAVERSSNIMEFPIKSPYDCSTAETYTSCKLPKKVPDWWKELRQTAYLRFWDQGLPTPKLERFKYTNIAKVTKDYDGVPGEHHGQVENGEGYVRPLSECLDLDWVQEALKTESPGANKYGDSALWDLNMAYLEKGAVIDIPAGENVKLPINMTLEGVDDSYIPLHLIVRVQQGANLTLTETHKGEGEYWKNLTSFMIVEKNAKLVNIRVQNDSKEAVHTQYTHIKLDRDAVYEGFSLNMGAAVSRHQAQADLGGENGNASFNGLNLLNEKQHGDTTILIEHQKAHCQSNQSYRSLINDQAHGVFQGKVHVYEDAQKTDGYQLSNTLLLSEQAMMDTKPELEIYADDVQCSHGATTGQLDEEPLFYLRSRGLSEKEARFLMIQAFVSEVLDKIENEEIKERLESDVMEWLQTML